MGAEAVPRVVKILGKRQVLRAAAEASDASDEAALAAAANAQSGAAVLPPLPSETHFTRRVDVVDALADSLVRLLALLAVAGGAASEAALGGGAPAALVALLSDTTAPDGLVGNAALAASELARGDAGLETLAQLDPVPALIKVAHTRRGTAQKNAAIALARLARDPACLEKIRELHGFEIIAAYVKV